jgi:hypothetical protein
MRYYQIQLEDAILTGNLATVFATAACLEGLVRQIGATVAAELFAEASRER